MRGGTSPASGQHFVGTYLVHRYGGRPSAPVIRAFRETTGMTPYQWLISERIDRAGDLLRTNASLAEIAIACGFADQSHFTRVFSNIVGATPGNWRRHA